MLLPAVQCYAAHRTTRRHRAKPLLRERLLCRLSVAQTELHRSSGVPLVVQQKEDGGATGRTKSKREV